MLDTRVIAFPVGAQCWAIDVDRLREIVVGRRLFKVPLAPRTVAGLVNVRGQVVTAVDVDSCLNSEPARIDQGRACLVLKNEGGPEMGVPSELGSDTLGLLVEDSLEMIDLAIDELHDVPAHIDGSLAGYIQGIATEGDRLIFILNVGELLHAASRQEQQ